MANTEQMLPLSGVRVLDWTRLLPGPWCTQLLSDLGADVIKVEQRGIGDASRHNAPKYQNNSVYFHNVNGGKRGITIDLASPNARPMTERLIGSCDVMIESFSTSVAVKFGIDAAAALRINPKLVHCSISGYGQTGPLAPVPGHDLVIQAATGLLAPGNTTPQMPSFQTADYAGAMMACIGILAALRRRDQHGIGAAIDISMFDGMFQLGQIGLGSAVARYAGVSGDPMMEVWGGNPRYALYPTKDNKTIAVSLLELRYWQKFCGVIGRPDLAAEHEDPSVRHTGHGAMNDIYRKAISDYCLAHTRDDIASAMAKQDVPVIPVLTPDEALVSEHVVHRELVGRGTHPTDGNIAYLRSPLHLSGLTRKDRRPAPEMGEHNQAVLSDLGFSPAEIADLTASKTI
jgi:crotonobetainyl-CoA:carnitine CoA-transferase CaiB-like acyl-CoA transferase